MMHRPAAGADAEPVGGGNGAADIGLGVAHRVAEVWPLARPAAMAEASVQPLPWVLTVAIRGAAKRLQASALPEHRRCPAPLAVAALDQHRAGAQRNKPLRLIPHLGLVARDRQIEQGRRLGQVRGDQPRPGESAGAARRSRRRAAIFRRKSRPIPDRARHCGRGNDRARRRPPRSRLSCRACRSSPPQPRDRRRRRRSAR